MGIRSVGSGAVNMGIPSARFRATNQAKPSIGFKAVNVGCRVVSMGIPSARFKSTNQAIPFTGSKAVNVRCRVVSGNTTPSVKPRDTKARVRKCFQRSIERQILQASHFSFSSCGCCQEGVAGVPLTRRCTSLPLPPLFCRPFTQPLIVETEGVQSQYVYDWGSWKFFTPPRPPQCVASSPVVQAHPHTDSKATSKAEGNQSRGLVSLRDEDLIFLSALARWRL